MSLNYVVVVEKPFSASSEGFAPMRCFRKSEIDTLEG
jgi:hypothetical protein